MKKLRLKKSWLSTLVVCTALVLPDVALAAEISGSVIYDGERPVRKRVRLSGDPICVEIHTRDGKVKGPGRENLIVSKSLKIKNVFVYLKEVQGDFEPPAEPAILDQKDCIYVPHVQGMMAGQSLEVRNSDPTMHNVHSSAKRNRDFNRAQLQDARPMVVNVRRPEIGMAFKCDIHPWMSAYVHALAHPFFGTTNSKGKFRIKGVPPGEYTLVAWHEELGEQEQKIIVPEDGLTGVEFRFAPEEKPLWLR